MAQDMKSKDRIEWDGVVSGLGLRMRAGRQSWIVQRRVAGRTMRRKLGDGAELDRVAARAAAREVLVGIASGEVTQKMRIPTFNDFAERFLADRAPQLRPITLQSYRYDLKRHILPVFGAMRLDKLTKPMVLTWRDALVTTPGSKNRIMAVLSSVICHAELLELRAAGGNPCKGLRRRQVVFQAHYLTDAEYRRIATQLRHEEEAFPGVVAAIRFMALTGCRRTEALSLRWDWLDGSRFALPNSKTGPRALWMGRHARAIVAVQQGSRSHVFSHDGKPVPASRLETVWRRVRTRARLKGVRLHDLRHSFASVAVSNGLTLRTVGGLLGHRDLGSTVGYAQFQTASTEASADRVARHMQSMLKARTPKGSKRQKAEPEPETDIETGPDETNYDWRLVKRYRQSNLSVPEFCEAEGLPHLWVAANIQAAYAARKKRQARKEALA